MADEPKPEQKAPEGGNEAAPNTSESPAPAELVTPPTDGDAKAIDIADKPAAVGGPPAPGPDSKVQAEALSDGTVPTVLAKGSAKRKEIKGVGGGLSTIYRKADIMSTLLTFGVAALAGGLIIGGYIFFNRPSTKQAAAPKVSALNSADLNKLNAFFSGNSAGNSSEVLTVSSSSLFKNRVGIASDLKVTGGVSIDGTSTLGNLNVNQTSTLGVTDVRGSLVVAGPTNLQSPATLGAGGTVTGNLTVSGNGSFGGSISAGVINVANLSVSGSLNFNGHISIGGVNPSASPASGIASGAQVNGNDTAGTVSVSVGAGGGVGSQLVTVTFHSGFPVIPVVIITPIGASSAQIEPYISAGANSFTIGAGSTNGAPTLPAGNYSFNYWVVQ